MYGTIRVKHGRARSCVRLKTDVRHVSHQAASARRYMIFTTSFMKQRYAKTLFHCFTPIDSSDIAPSPPRLSLGHMFTFEAFTSATLQSWRGLAALSPLERRAADTDEQSAASTGLMAAGAPGHVAVVASERRALVVFDMVSELDMLVPPGMVQ